MPNPFFYGGRIQPANFIGREAELRRIFAALEIAYSEQIQSISIVGPRRSGKSSLLYYVTQIYRKSLSQPEKYRFVYIDLDDPRCHTLGGLLLFILNELGSNLFSSSLNHPSLRNLPENDQIKVPYPNLVDFQRIIDTLTHEQNLYIVLCLDEFEHLIKRKSEFPDEVFETWRSMANSGRVAFLTASQTPLSDLTRQGNLTSPFYNIFQPIYLDNFTKTEALSLLDRGKKCDRPFTEEECDSILRLVGTNPAMLQMASSLLYEAKAEKTVDWNALKRQLHEQTDAKKKIETQLLVKKPIGFLAISILVSIGSITGLIGGLTQVTLLIIVGIFLMVLAFILSLYRIMRA
jgi:hypothetical protein